MSIDNFKKGDHPFDRDEMTTLLPEFLEIYRDRPVQGNGGGMGPVHLFLSWYAIKKVNPSHVIESGTFKGLGTWVFEQAVPDAFIYSIDPQPTLYHPDSYTSQKPTTVYFHSPKDDFTNIGWVEYIEDPNDCVCFFDDHQNAVFRTLQAYSRGFSKLMFEDNYPTGEGDMLSIRHTLSEPEKYMMAPGVSVKSYLDRFIKVYHELPPIFSNDVTRWNTPWLESCAVPLLSSDNVSSELEAYWQNRTAYTHMAYVEV